MLVSFWVPLRVMNENIDQLLSEKGLFLGSNISHDDDPSKALLSIGHQFSCDLGYVNNIDIYGTNSDHLLHHLTNHLIDALARTTYKQLLFEIFAEPELKKEIEKAMVELGFKMHNWNVGSAMYCFGNDLKSNL